MIILDRSATSDIKMKLQPQSMVIISQDNLRSSLSKEERPNTLKVLTDKPSKTNSACMSIKSLAQLHSASLASASGGISHAEEFVV